MNKTVKAIAAAGIATAAFSGLGLAGCTAPKAQADAISGCEDLLWIVPFQSTRRAICDGVRRPDGSWLRARVFYTPEHYKPLTTNCYGRYSVSCTTTGGYWVPYNEARKETYIVFDHNVLPDEPGHLVNGVR